MEIIGLDKLRLHTIQLERVSYWIRRKGLDSGKYWVIFHKTNFGSQKTHTLFLGSQLS